MAYRAHRRPAATWLALLALAVVLVAVALAASALYLLRLVPFLLVAAFVVHVVTRRRDRVLQRRARRRPPEAGTVDWPTVRARFAALQLEYARFECDPLAVLRTPALADVTVPSTQRFVDAFAEAQALDSDSAPPPEHRDRFAAAVDRAHRAWEAARDAAERIALSAIPAGERATVDRAVALLALARDSGHPAERTAAYARARTELAKLERSGALRLPRPAAAALASAARGGLPAGG